MPVIKNDRELLQALLDGEKLEKIRHAGFGEVIYLKDDSLVNQDGHPANIYRLTSNDFFQTTDNYNIKEEDKDN